MDALDPIPGDLPLKWRVTDGGTPTVPEFEGRLVATRHGPFFLHVEADLGEPLGTRHGLVAMRAGRLVMAYGPKGKVEIGAYRLTGDRLDGTWVPPGAAGDDLSKCGRELSRKQGDRYVIEQAHAVDQQPYTGSLKIEPIGAASGPVRPVRIAWSLHDGDYTSFGLMGVDFLVSTFNFEKGTPCGVAVYASDGKDWEGWTLDEGATVVGGERWTRRG